MHYNQTVPAFLNALGALRGQLDKARSWGAENGVTEDQFMASRLAPDMLPLATQVRFCCAQAVQPITRLTGLESPTFTEDASDFAGMKAQIATATDFLSALDPTVFKGDPDRQISFDLPIGMTFDLSADDYIRDWVLPQFYFHIMAAYAVMRHTGVPLGKADFASYMMRHLRPGTAPAA